MRTRADPFDLSDVPSLLTTLSVAATTLAVDLATKQIYYGREPRDLSPFFSLRSSRNHGGVFGLFSDGGATANIFFITVSLAAVVFLCWVYLKSKTRHPLVFSSAVGCVLGGAAGNLIDRLLYGFVRDFLDFHIAGYSWPTFNVADSAICIGTFLLAWTLWKPAGEPA